MPFPVIAQAGLLNPPSHSINPHAAAAFAAAIVCGLLLLQYAHRRRRFILLWAAGWLLVAAARLIVARGYQTPWIGHVAIGTSHLLAVSTAGMFLWSADVLRQTQFVQRGHLRWLGGLAAYFLITPLVFGDAAVNAPGYLVTAVILGGAGAMYAAVLLERRMIGAGLIAFVLFGLAVSNMTSAFANATIAARPEFSYALLLVNLVLYAAGALGVHLLIFEDMTYELRVTNRRLEAAQEELMQAAITDPLTGCHNRRFLDQVVDRELQRHARFELPLSLLFIDINRFKQVNDKLGHDAGDELLRFVAKFLKRNIREADYIFRRGRRRVPGDDHVHGRGGAAESVRPQADQKAPEISRLPRGIGLSVGWIEVPADTEDLTPLVREADARMYQDKASR